MCSIFGVTCKALMCFFSTLLSLSLDAKIIITIIITIVTCRLLFECLFTSNSKEHC